MPYNRAAARYCAKNPAEGITPLRTDGAEPGGKTASLRLIVSGKRKGGKAAFTFSCVCILAVALVSVLLLNMSISSRQYYLVRLKNEEKNIRQNNQVLRQEVEKGNVSQNLAARAVKLGMVPLTSAAYLNVQDGTIRGEVKAARKEERMEQNVPSPQLPHVGILKPDRQGSAPPENLRGEPGIPEDPVTGGRIPSPQQRVLGDQSTG